VLIEVLVAVVLLSLGTVLLMRLQTGLRHNSDLARQRSEAIRLAEEDVEALRSFTRIDTGAGGRAWADIAAAGDQPLDLPGAPTAYRLARSVQTGSAPALKSVTPTIGWTDRQGQPRRLALPTLIAPVDPSLLGALLLQRDGGRADGAFGRHPLIPLTARELPDGRIVYQPRPGGTLVWIFDAATARVTGRCRVSDGLASSELTAASLSDCRALSGLLLAGTLRFATDRDNPAAADTENPLGSAVDLDLRVTLSSTGHPDPAWECDDDAPAGVPPAATLQTVVHYACVLQPAGNPPRWSGRLDIVPRGWTLADSLPSGTASSPDRLRVCRYSADHDGNGRIDNREHPLRYSSVSEPLADQNFLLVRAGSACPRDQPASPADPPNWVDDSTVAHQP
jgi:Tfp pilus assembly protein PilV